jgi:hypothetical protein
MHFGNNLKDRILRVRTVAKLSGIRNAPSAVVSKTTRFPRLASDGGRGVLGSPT